MCVFSNDHSALSKMLSPAISITFSDLNSPQMLQSPQPPSQINQKLIALPTHPHTIWQLTDCFGYTWLSNRVDKHNDRLYFESTNVSWENLGSGLCLACKGTTYVVAMLSKHPPVTGRSSDQCFELVKSLNWACRLTHYQTVSEGQVFSVCVMCSGPFSDLLRHAEMYSDTHWSAMDMEKGQQGRIWFW